MTKILSYIVGSIIVGFCLLPHININLMAPGEWFQYLVYLFGFASVAILYFKINWFIRLLPAFCLINAMMSYVPLLSMIAWMQITVCCYFYVLCCRVKHFDIIFKMIQSVLVFTVILYIMKLFGQEPIANFGDNQYFGTNGQHMQSASLTIILTAVLISHSRWNLGIPLLAVVICNSLGALISAVIGVLIFLKNRVFSRKEFNTIFVLSLVLIISTLGFTGKFVQNINMGNSRILTWINTLRLCTEYPFFGWGIGTFKVLFPIYGKIEFAIPWKTTHNDYLQLLFEMGLTGMVFFLAFCTDLIYKMRKLIHRTISKDKAFYACIGLAMIATNMLYHFPTKMIQAVPLIIFFLAYCQKLYEVTYGE